MENIKEVSVKPLSSIINTALKFLSAMLMCITHTSVWPNIVSAE